MFLLIAKAKERVSYYHLQGKARTLHNWRPKLKHQLPQTNDTNTQVEQSIENEFKANIKKVIMLIAK